MSALPPYKVSVTRRFLAISFFCPALLCLVLGILARSHIDGLIFKFHALYPLELKVIGTDTHADTENPFPVPFMKGGKEVPRTTYTSRIFDTSRPVTSSSIFLEEKRKKKPEKDEAYKEDRNQTFADYTSEIVPIVADNDEEHLPAGQHLLVDISGVDATFLDSEKRLANAMVDIVYECGLTMLSYHCFHLMPSGVSCAGVLLESHVSFHTWPEAGVITLDLFTCGANSLLPHVDSIKDLFAIPRSDSAEAPKMLWAYKRRGFSEGFGSGIVKSTDIFAHPLGMRGLEMKQEIMSVETGLEQIIRVYDVIQHPYNSLASYEKSLSKEKSYESEHPDLFQPDRLVFLDGVMKTRRLGESASHESLVHPAMITHSEPKNVAMVGAGEGATLREVLKHKSVERVVVLEADETIVQVAKEHLKDWNDCSNLVGGSPSCFDDPRVEIYYEDGPTWFSRRRQDNDKFDVVIVDTLDGDEYEEDESEYNDKSFFASIHNALSEEGIVVVHVVGEVETGDAPPLPKRKVHSTDSDDTNEMSWIQSLSSSGFAETRYYEENHGGVTDFRNYLVGFKSSETIKNWNKKEASFSLEIKKRSVATVDGKWPFRYFDGPTMVSYTRSTEHPLDLREYKHSTDSKHCVQLSKWNRYAFLNASRAVIKECSMQGVEEDRSTCNASMAYHILDDNPRQETKTTVMIHTTSPGSF